MYNKLILFLKRNYKLQKHISINAVQYYINEKDQN